MHRNVEAVLDRPLQIGTGKGVVGDRDQLVPLGDLGDPA